MKWHIPTLAVGLLLTANFVVAGENLIRLNTVGYLPTSPKVASIATNCAEFKIIRVKDDAAVFTGKTSGPKWNAPTSENLFIADFSTWREPGIYQLEVNGVKKSAPFVIDAGAFTRAYQTTMLGIYLWRCGTAVTATFADKTFSHSACHTNDALMDFVGNASVRQPANGGWHDAGDYNKYVINAGVSVGVLLRAWEDFGGALKKVSLQLPPVTNALPDFLREVKYELDWLLQMQATNGAVYHMVSARNFDAFEMPEEETEPRYFSSWSSAATALNAAMLAQAARDFREFDAAYADRCLKAAEKSYSFLAQHPDYQPTDRTAFNTGIYQIRSETGRLWAAVELWETTGETKYLNDFETAAQKLDSQIHPEFDYGDYRNLAMVTYLNSKRAGRNATLLASAEKELREIADDVVAAGAADGYARPLGNKYFWGCNGTVARQTVLLHTAEKLFPKPEYRTTALDAVNYLLGRNYFGRSFVTGVGFEPPLHPHDRLSASLNLGVPCPGRLVGGPRNGPKDWVDEEGDFSRNEIAINWNTALIYALAKFLPEPTGATAPARIAQNR